MTQINFVYNQRFISAAMRSRPASPSASFRCCPNGISRASASLTIIALLPEEADGRPRYRSNHYQINLAVLEALSRQTIPGDFLDPAPILAEIARSLLLGFKFRLQAASPTLISVCNLQKIVCRPSSISALLGKLLRVDCSFVIRQGQAVGIYELLHLFCGLTVPGERRRAALREAGRLRTAAEINRWLATK